MGPAELTRLIKEESRRLGFDAVGVATAGEIGERQLRRWLQSRFHGRMAYMERHFEKRVDPRALVPGARSVVSLALNYTHPYRLPYGEPERAAISRYASGDDYHEVVRERCKRLFDYVQGLVPEVRGRYYVDTGPVLDKAWGQRAGIGWIGKHTNLLAKRRLGSWFFLGELILDLELEPDAPAADHCGSCTRCIEACPTDAIVAPYVLDSRRCISYLTIELREDIPEQFRPGMDNLVFGCDVCQDVCPWNRKAEEGREKALAPRAENRAPRLDELAGLTPEEFSRRFRRSAVKRTKWRGLMRNVAVALGNSGEPSSVPALAGLLEVDDPMVRRHAAWGLWRLATPEAIRLLEERRQVEPDEPTRDEIGRLLARREAM